MSGFGSKLGAVAPTSEGFRPGRVLAVDIDTDLPALGLRPIEGGEPYGFALVLVRLHGTPLGTLQVDLTGGTREAGQLAEDIEEELGAAIADHLARDRAHGGAVCPDQQHAAATAPVSVVIATYHRPDLIVPCVASVLANDHPSFEVIVVDNSPDDPRTKAALDEHFGGDHRVQHLPESRPGTSHARNTGIRAANNEIIVFTDDDVVTDPAWMRNLTAPFVVDPTVACVTGLTEPYELETEAQVWFEQYGGFSGGFAPGRLELGMDDPPTTLFPFTSPAGGSNNMAIRRSVALRLGAFDVRLGPGTPTLGGEDLDLTIRLLLDGETIAYEPRALVWHRHRRTEEDLLAHVYGYGAGSVAVLSKWFEHSPALRSKVVRHAARLPAAFGPREQTTDGATKPPARVARAQIRGSLSGPTRWARARGSASDEARTPAPIPQHAPDVTAVVCTYTDERWDQFVAAVESLQTQSPPPTEVLVVVDHAPALAERAARELPGVRVIENTETKGLSGGRNTALRAAQTELVAFLDDDAIAEPDLLARLGSHFEDPHVLCTGGRATPAWQDQQPSWFPDEFLWVIGCTYRGLPEHLAEVRNPLGCAMIVRREAALEAGGYRTDLGRVGKHPAGCEETELCIRLGEADPAARVLYDPDAEIHHFVPSSRCSGRYFRSRCYAEGRSKAIVRSLSGPNSELGTERTYVLEALPRGFARGLFDAMRGRWSGLGRSGAIAVGLVWTVAGFVVGTIANKRPRLDRRSRPEAPSGSEAPFEPTWITALDLDAPIQDLVAPPSPSGGPYERAQVVGFIHQQPIGVVPVEVQNGRLTAGQLKQQVVPLLAAEAAAHNAADVDPDQACWVAGLEPIRPPSFSVVLCTRNRTEQAELAITQIAALDYPDFEIVVVDNAPADDATEKLVTAFARKDPRIRYVREDVPGLASARNCGIAAAEGDVIAFTDDDIRVPPGWLRAIAHAFERSPDVVCVTGSVMSPAINTRAEQLFDEAFAFGTKWGLDNRLFDPEDPSPTNPLFPYQVGVYGAGAAMAFDRDYLVHAGGFDPALGTGTPTRGGEDLDAFLEVMANGRSLAYEPAAFVWHHHHTDDSEVRIQTFRYGVGLGAFLFKIAFTRTHAPRLLARMPRGLRYLVSASSEKNAQKTADFPRSLTLIELLGIAWGPVAYLQSRRVLRGRGTLRARL